MSYSIGHLSSTSSSKCVVCGKYVSSYVAIDDFNKDGYRKKGTSIVIPACDGECRKQVVDKKDILLGYAKSINGLFKIK